MKKKMGSHKLARMLKTCLTSTGVNRVFITSPAKGEASEVLQELEGGKFKTEVLLRSADPFSRVIESLSKSELTVIYVDIGTLLNSLHQLQGLRDHPVMVYVELEGLEYSKIPLFRELAFPIIISSDVDDLSKTVYPGLETVLKKRQPLFHFYRLEPLAGSDLDVHLRSSSGEGQESEQLDALEELDHYYNVRFAGTPRTLILNLSPYGRDFEAVLPVDTAFFDFKLYKPIVFSKMLESVSHEIENILIIQGSAAGPSDGFEPVLLDVFSDYNAIVDLGVRNVVVTNVGLIVDFSQALGKLLENVSLSTPDQHLYLSDKEVEVSSDLPTDVVRVQSLEASYTNVLLQIFESKLKVLNHYSEPAINASNPEYGFGKYLRQKENRDKLVSLVRNSLDASYYHVHPSEVVQLLSRWLDFNHVGLDESSLSGANKVAEELLSLLEENSSSEVAIKLVELAPSVDLWSFYSTWLVGSDAWSYDLGASGVHNVLTSKANINVLLIDSEPYESVKASKTRKKDIGLYAMNFGNVYVASVAVYSSYTQLLTALIEASKFNGPSIVLAYLPYHSETDTSLTVLKETKNAIESGYWPLYRYNPNEEDEENIFKLDSNVIKRQLQDFLERENKLSILAKRSPDFARFVSNSVSDDIERKQQKHATAAFEQLLQGLSGPPLHIYYASDGGNASGLAGFLGKSASKRGLKSSVLSMDSIELEELPGEENVIFITSTAGQGEFPQDGKAFWDKLKAATDLDLSALNFSVFGLGDSMYWPRKEDKHYYNKPSKQLYTRLESLGATPIVPLGLGDEQDADGYQTGYSEWVTNLWEALGVASIGVDEENVESAEDIKLNSNYLRGTIAEGLKDESTGGVSSSNNILLKFHGIYTQDDRDVRDLRKSQGLEAYYIFMARIRLPGGIATPQQYLMLDHLADTSGNGTVKLTTRATFQLHGIIKSKLKHAIRGLNAAMLDTLAAAGDVNRNVMVTALPHKAKVHKQVAAVASSISELLLPNTTAYHEIWLEGPDNMDEDPAWAAAWNNRKEGPKKKMLVGGNALQDVEPLYGATYLPRKFKVNITVPPYNDVDVWATDIGLIAIIDDDDNLLGFNFYAGGGMGTTHNNKKTYPRLATCLGYVAKEDLLQAIEKVVIIQRDNGDRKNRKHARLKYTIDDMGVDVFREKVEELWGKKFGPERPYNIASNIDYYGWVKDELGRNHFTVFIENGRIEDTATLPHKTGLRKVGEYLKEHECGHFRLTGNQHIIVSGIPDEHLEPVKTLLKKYKLDNYEFTGLRLSSAACVAFPTCVFAMAESERYLPSLISKLEEAVEEYGLRHDSIVMRMSGCPNGCSRPWLAEIACVGKAPGIYNLLLGGGYYGQRLNKLYRASVNEEEILSIVKPLLKRWSLERESDEHFGDFLVRVGVIKPTLEGKYFHEDVPEEAY